MDSANRLKVEAVTTTDAGETADEGLAFCVDGIAQVTNSEKTVIYLSNNSGIIELGRMIVSVQATIPLTSGISGNNTIIRIYHGQAVFTGGSSKTPINSNSGSLNVANVTVLTNGPTLSSGTDTEIAQFYFLLSDTLLIDLIGTIILAQGGSFRVTCASGGAANIGNCAVSIQFFQELP